MFGEVCDFEVESFNNYVLGLFDALEILVFVEKKFFLGRFILRFIQAGLFLERIGTSDLSYYFGSPHFRYCMICPN